ncbi:D-alanyl-D-alanine carboxypeptidase family protein [Streptomyces zingiberis]|uniref:D-alanyl-D-alanine carboxypeptidase n=1 Tax=Streptomyces zingiberis TaxID=2053010 RepID=A0ABX1BS52_9ACTN|nr:D-alanyl-D-alanine carboxypeptidase [Streptomyces zingiberis]NJP99887.1 D-alanyl-D-alanine carboxypeptidase [Streptomyces zingiberis]
MTSKSTGSGESDVPGGPEAPDRQAPEEKAPEKQTPDGKATGEKAPGEKGSGPGGAGRTAPAAGAVDQPTTAIRVRRPRTGTSGDAERDSRERDGDGPGADGGSSTPDARTGTETGTGTGARPGRGAGTGTGGTPDAGADGGTGSGARTGTGSGGTGTGTGSAPATASSPTSGGARAGTPRTEESAAERTSTFVPLQSAEEAPRTPRKAGGSAPAWAARASTAGGTAAGTAPGTGAAGGGNGASAAGATSAPGTDTASAGAGTTASPAGTASAGTATGTEPGAASPEAEAEVESERTKQQPLPPLDLLAQLTNTPPPPETPLRTMVRRVKIWTPLVLLLAIVFAVAQAVRPLPEPTLTLTAESQFAFDGQKPSLPWPEEGQAHVEISGLGSLGSSGKEKPVPIGSVAKVMTAYVFLKDHPVKKGGEGVKMKVDARAVEEYEKGKADQESVVPLKEGQMLSEYEALEALMLPSANNVARLMARWYEQKHSEDFVDKMNAAAEDLGMENTTFTDPSGLEKDTVSTAKDLVKLGKAAMAIPVFKEISAKTEYVDSQGERHLNYNRLVPYTGIGIKTGTTTAAGGNLLFAAEQRIAGTTQLIIGAALAQYKVPAIDSVTAVSKQLIESAQAALVDAKVVKKGEVVGHVDDGLGGRTPVVVTEDVTAVGWPGLTVDLALTEGGRTIPHEAAAGTKVGLLTVGSGPGQVKVGLALEEPKEEPGFGAKLFRIL